MWADVRPERPSDPPAIRCLLQQAFPTAAEADLVDRLQRDGDCALSLVVEADGEVVGHILFSAVAAPFRALGLAPLAVRSDRQRRGIGDALVRQGLALAAAGEWEGVFVLGEPAYYTRFGFDAALARGFGSPYAGPNLMALSLRGDALPAREGPVSYAPAFAALR